LTRAWLLAAVLALLLAAPASAAPELVKIGDFTDPVHVASPPNDTRVFVVEKGGRVKIAGGGTFLDASALTNGNDEERGLLSIAFPPDYASSGKFYVFLTDASSGALRVLEYLRSADPSRANPAPARELLSIPHGPEYHNGGQLQFGPDGMLYVSTGDGHTSANAQDVNSLLGKILRLDPATGGAAPGNPYGRVWAYGLRNPWRFTFDRATGDMLIGDVGDDQREEVDWARGPNAASGLNFGWPCYEGRVPFDTTMHCPNAVFPLFDYSHDGGACSVTGGVVVHDPRLPKLDGVYLYADLCVGALEALRIRKGAVPESVDLGVTIGEPASFGVDGLGRVYVTSLAGGVYRLDPR
jgi:glucose/arabinose dehydrogenase